ncbi:ethanolamine ammonia-lyase subunit EutC [Rossellomorea aquimaris]|uniref:Ethanolamine ammonia-lyase small subunit n=1 Tax=Rossellomorea aquimaris TaxID=189382 RepID=A0A1J6WU92_9BACI|nr:ethanolamine ammonia-lyase subunit EutC [Rossellomorea aquimaris]OIU71795.1 ethanolamine ammonia-lyase [Rossellomorea aquimaris]
MNPELIEQVTKMVIEKIQSRQQSTETSNTDKASPVKFWDHTSASKNKSDYQRTQDQSRTESGGKLIEIKSYTDSATTSRQKTEGNSVESSQHREADSVSEELKDLQDKTPARIGVGRAGVRPKTDTWLKFRFDHAAAVDAVYGDVNDSLLSRLDLFKVNTLVEDKEIYIRRPDYGRKLSEEAKKTISERCNKSPTVQIVVSDGLSSSAIEENVEDVFFSLKQSLTSLDLDMGTPFYIEKGRVAVMDDVGELLKPKVVVLLIGERPGLVSAESLSAYLCYEPGKGTIEADRMVISNIHKGGIPPVEAGAYLGTVIQKVLKYEASGVSLVKKEE